MGSSEINFAAIPQYAIGVLTSPAKFFKEMPKKGGYVEPLVFMAAMGLVGGVIQAVLSIVGLTPSAGMGMGLASIIAMPVAAAIFGFVGAAIVFGIWKLMGSQEDYEVAYRCTAYISAVMPITVLLQAIPYAGSAIGVVIYTYYLIIASVEVHNLPSRKAWLVFGIIGAVLIVLGLSAEYSARRLVTQTEKMRTDMEGTANAMKQQVEQAQKQAEQAQKQAEEAMKQMQQQAPGQPAPAPESAPAEQPTQDQPPEGQPQGGQQ